MWRMAQFLFSDLGELNLRLGQRFRGDSGVEGSVACPNRRTVVSKQEIFDYFVVLSSGCQSWMGF